MLARDRRLMLLAALASSVLVLVLAFVGHLEVLAYLSPMLAVALPLVAGRYLGEDTLERLRERSDRPARRARPAPARPSGRLVLALVPRGGRLIAHSLAERGPPAAALS